VKKFIARNHTKSHIEECECALCTSSGSWIEPPKTDDSVLEATRNMYESASSPGDHTQDHLLLDT
jgi:hypothetical protein